MIMIVEVEYIKFNISLHGTRLSQVSTIGVTMHSRVFWQSHNLKSLKMAVVSPNFILPFSRLLKSSLVLGLSLLGPLLSPAVAKVDGYALTNY